MRAFAISLVVACGQPPTTVTTLSNHVEPEPQPDHLRGAQYVGMQVIAARRITLPPDLVLAGKVMFAGGPRFVGVRQQHDLVLLLVDDDGRVTDALVTAGGWHLATCGVPGVVGLVELCPSERTAGAWTAEHNRITKVREVCACLY